MSKLLRVAKRSRPHLSRGRKRFAAYKWQKQLASHSDEAARICQKILRTEPAVTAHRVCEGAGCEVVTVKADRTKAEVKIGVDASDVADMKHVVSVYVDGEKVRREEFPLDIEEEDLGAKAAEILRDELNLAYPEEPVLPDTDEVGEFGAQRVASFRGRR